MATSTAAWWACLQQERQTQEQQRVHPIGGAESRQQQAFDEFVREEAAAWQQTLENGWQQCQQQHAVYPSTSYSVGLKRMRSGALETPAPLYFDWAPPSTDLQDAALDSFVYNLHSRYLQSTAAQQPLSYGKDACLGLSPTSVYGGCPSGASSGCATPQDACLGPWAPSPPACAFERGYALHQQQPCELSSPLKRLRVDQSNAYGGRSFTWIHDSRVPENYGRPVQAAPRPAHRKPPTSRRSMEDLRYCVAAPSRGNASFSCADYGLVRSGRCSQAMDVLGRWSSALSLDNVETVPFAFHLWSRVASGALTQNRHPLDAVLAACLWISAKLHEHRMVVPSAVSLSSLSGMPIRYLRRAEKAVMSCVDWAPLSEW
eukprot:CAMPEP_0177778172 /NCGR_PEP_ID=MMETSP0491_2-20121128/15804_1 /TAXON_ID=63592 /ORGANISM="Tetraselmis chuii, Strain PLY429" /LENGTH=373 /DNA_ID=CAMNT_0019297411 /DNA_START=358 /DNA_END=1476 /DNA_ORIENTATION=+